MINGTQKPFLGGAGTVFVSSNPIDQPITVVFSEIIISIQIIHVALGNDLGIVQAQHVVGHIGSRKR
jgi:hypothetical protein